MSRIFISHSSRDDAQARDVRDWLADNGWDDVFLDLDPERGLVAGKRWIDALRDAVHRCEAIIVLISKAWLDSTWCVAEANASRLLGKQIIPILIDAVDVKALPAEMTAEQIVDRCADPDWEIRLREGLRRANLAAASFTLEENRRPYPGLEALTEDDPAIFFGRESDIVRAMSQLRAIEAAGVEQLMVILGASGAGKSSFLRAGLWPRLKRDDHTFLPLPVIRPERAAISGAYGVARAFELAADDDTIRALLEARGFPTTRGGAEKLVASRVNALCELLAAWRDCVTAPGATGARGKPPSIVLPIDQGEELFDASGRDEASQFLDSVRHALSNVPGLIVLVTIRSDAYPRLQAEKRLFDAKRDTSHLFNLGPMPVSSFRQVIEEPAKLVRPRPLAIDPRLTDATINAAKGADALPLLAFSIERLHAKYGKSGVLTLEAYEDLGGLRGAIDAAVEPVIESARSDRKLPDDRRELEQLLRRTFASQLADVAEDGRVSRRVAALEGFDDAIRPLVDLFCEQHLLVKDRRGPQGRESEVVEVAHEALLREWPLLADWLEDHKDELRTASAVTRAAEDWRDNQCSDEWLDHSGGRLDDAEALLSRPDLARRIGTLGKDYLAAARARQKRLRRRFRLTVVSAFVIVLALAVLASVSWYRAQGAARTARSEQKRATREMNRAEEEKVRAEAARAQAAREAARAEQLATEKTRLAEKQTRLREEAEQLATEQTRLAEEAEAARDRLALLLAQKYVGSQGVVQAQLLVQKSIEVGKRGADPQLQLLLAYEAWRGIGDARLSNVSDALLRAIARIGGLMVAGGPDCTRLKSVQFVRQIRDGKALVAEGIGDAGRVACVWDLTNPRDATPPTAIRLERGEYVLDAVGPRRELLVSIDPHERVFHVRDLASLPGPVPSRTLDAGQLDADSFDLSRITMAPKISVDLAGRWIVGASDRTVWLWPLSSRNRSDRSIELVTDGSTAMVRRVQLSFDGNWLFTSHGNSWIGTVRIWRLRTGESGKPTFEIVAKEKLDTDFAVFSPDNRWLLTSKSGLRAELIFWHLDRPSLLMTRVKDDVIGINHTIFSANGRWLFTAAPYAGRVPKIWSLDAEPHVAVGMYGKMYTSIRAAAFVDDDEGMLLIRYGTTLFYRRSLGAASADHERQLNWGDVSWTEFAAGSTGRWVVNESCQGGATMYRGALLSKSTSAFGRGTCSAGTLRSTLDSSPMDIHPQDVLETARGGPRRASYFLQDDAWHAVLGSRTGKLGKERSVDLFLVPLIPDDFDAVSRAIATRNLSREEWDLYFPGEPHRKTFEHLPLAGAGQ